MTQDYAKRHNTVNTPGREFPRWYWLFIGFVLGLFTAFLYYLWQVVPPDLSTDAIEPRAKIIADKIADEIQLEFYEMFPKSEVPIVEEYNPQGDKFVVKDHYSYALQTGSFINKADADRLRAQLLLLDMPVFIQEVEHQNKKWHRVLVGPMDSQLALDRTRIRLAEANIESIRLRMSQ